MKLLGDTDPEGTRQNLLKMVSVMQRIPEMTIVPSHDQRAYAEMAGLPERHHQGPAPVAADKLRKQGAAVGPPAAER
jgi:hypothetical protein